MAGHASAVRKVPAFVRRLRWAWSDTVGSVSSGSMTIAPNAEIEDEKGFNVKEAAILLLGIGLLTRAAVGKIGLLLDAFGNRGLRFVPAGQFGLLLWLVLSVLIVTAVLRPKSSFGTFCPLMGAILVGGGVLSAVVA